MQGSQRRPTNEWIAIARPRPEAAVRLICFSHAGGGAAGYALWPNFLADGIEVCAIQLPGRENRVRESGMTAMSELVPLVVDNLIPVLDRPFAFYGHSMGAIVAFETARHLRRIGAALPLALLVGASRPPQMPWPFPPIRHLPDIEFLTEVNHRYESVPRVILDDPEFRDLLTPGLRADFSVVETYRCEPEPAFDFPIAVFGGQADRSVAEALLPQWQEQTTGSSTVRMFSGGHLFLQSNRASLVAEVGAEVSAAARQVGSRG